MVKKKPHDSFSQRLHRLFFSNMDSPGVFIECGANTGYEGCVCHWLEYSMGWFGINIEPNPHCFEELEKRRPNCVNLDFALSNKDDRALMKYPIDGPRKLFAGQASLSPQRPKEWARKNRQVRDVMVDTARYDTLVDHFIDAVAKRQVDLMVLDVEGHELEVIEGMSNSIYLPRVICAEHVLVSAKQMMKLLGPMGYRIGGGDVHNTYFVRK